jgi:hypothetical protein
MLIKTAYDRGYIDFEWVKGSPGNKLQNIDSELYEFQHIILRQDLVSKLFHIRAEVIDTVSNSAINLPTVTVTKELLEDLGVVFNGNSFQEDVFLKKIIDVMGTMNYWTNAAKTGTTPYNQNAPSTPYNHYTTKVPYKKSQKTNPLILNDQDVEWLNKFNSREKTLREIDQEKQISALQNIIEDLKIEIKDLKEEIKMLNGINQEC